MAHYVAPEVTGGSVPAIHAGINYKFSQFTHSTTASASSTIAICVIPAGARIVGAQLSVDNDDLNTTGAGGITLQSWTGANVNGNIIKTAAASTIDLVYNPEHDVMALRHTASSHAVIKLFNWPATGTGTATTIFSVALLYVTQEDGD